MATLTFEGLERFRLATGHVETVHRLVLDALTQAQRKQLREICRRIARAIRDDEGWGRV